MGARLRVAALAAVVALAPGGCGTDDDLDAGDLGGELGDRADDPTDRAALACSLLEPDEIAAELDAQVGAPLSGSDECTFAIGADQGLPGSGTLEVAVPAPLPGLDPESYFASLRPVAGSSAVDGVGDDAFYEPEEGRLSVLVGSSVVRLRASVMPEPADLVEQLTRLGVIATDRMEPTG